MRIFKENVIMCADVFQVVLLSEMIIIFNPERQKVHMARENSER